MLPAPLVKSTVFADPILTELPELNTRFVGVNRIGWLAASPEMSIAEIVIVAALAVAAITREATNAKKAFIC